MNNREHEPTPSEIGEAFKVIAKRLKNYKTDDAPCEKYGCLDCKHFQREQGYDYAHGMFGFYHHKCKKQPNRNMNIIENTYDIFDIKPDYSPHFHYENAKGECPYFECGENELIYMSEKEKQGCPNSYGFDKR